PGPGKSQCKRRCRSTWPSNRSHRRTDYDYPALRTGSQRWPFGACQSLYWWRRSPGCGDRTHDLAYGIRGPDHVPVLTGEEAPMPSQAIQTMGVVGAGQMGAGIACVSALTGCEVLLYDIHTGSLEAALERIHKGFDKQ